MSRKMRAILGRIDVRMLLLMAVACFVFAIAQGARTPSPAEAEQTISTWDDLLKKYLAYRDQSYCLIAPAWYLDQDQVEEIFNEYGLAGFAQEPDWYWSFDGGAVLYAEKSPLAKLVKHGTQVVIYEDMANQEMLILSVPAQVGQPYKEEIAYKCPAWPDVALTENYAAYLSSELSKRRVAWRVTLKNNALAAQEDQKAAAAAAEVKGFGGGGGGIMSFLSGQTTTELWIVEMKKQTNGIRLEVCYPSTFSGMVWSAYSYDAPACMVPTGAGGGGNPNPPGTNECTNCSSGSCSIDATNTFQGLAGNPWTLAFSNLVLTGETQTAWLDTRPLGFDAMTNPVHRYYGFGNNSVDTDGDDLSDARELLAHKTSPANTDSDGDGAGDGAEVAHGTNPLNNPGDTDGDGLSDDLEMVMGTSVTNADSDLDWASDGYEREMGTDPLSVSNTPMLMPQINSGGMFATSTNIALSITGLVAQKLIISETPLFHLAVTSECAPSVSYAFPDATNGWRTIFLIPLRGVANQAGPTMIASAILDTQWPQLTLGSPTNGFRTSARWVRVEGVASDSCSYVKIKVNGDWADGVISGLYYKARLRLDAGTNTIAVTAEDVAGNVVTQRVSVVQDFAGDTNAPVVLWQLPEDFEIVGGATNWLGRTTLGDETNITIVGSLADETAEITAMAASGFSTSGPYLAAVGDTQAWINVPLDPGTNLIECVASDAAGNATTSQLVVVRETNFVLQITYPAPFEVLNSTGVIVQGLASLQFSNAVITVNGHATTVTNTGSNLVFETTSAVELQDGVTKIAAAALLDGRSYNADPAVVDYEVTEWMNSGRWSDQSFDLEGGGVGGGYSVATWTKESCELVTHSVGIWHSWAWFGQQWDSIEDTTTVQTLSAAPVESGYSMGFAQEARAGGSGGSASDWSGSGAMQIRVLEPAHDGDMAILRMPGLDYARNPEAAFDPAQVKFRGQPGFWYSGEPAFMANMQAGVEYVINAGDFDFPPYSFAARDEQTTTTDKGRVLSVFDENSSSIEVEFDVAGRWVLPAKTSWPDAPESLTNASSLEVAIRTTPTGLEDRVTLVINRVEPLEPQTAPGELIQDPTNSSIWHYDAFFESKNESHPELKRIYVDAYLNGSICGSEHVSVASVFRHLSAPMAQGFEQDRESAWRYAKWKYDIDTSSLSDISYDSAQSEDGLTYTVTDTCTLGPGAFASENWCAGVLLHENVHGYQSWEYIVASQVAWSLGQPHAAEVDAHNAQLNASLSLGLSAIEIGGITAWRDYYNRTGPHP